MNDELETLRDTERNCLHKINVRARKLMAADPRLTPAIARGKAIEEMPNTAARFLQARSTLGMMGMRPLQFDDVD